MSKPRIIMINSKRHVNKVKTSLYLSKMTLLFVQLLLQNENSNNNNNYPIVSVHGFNLILMGSKRRPGGGSKGTNDLKRLLNDDETGVDQIRSLNNGLGQEITGVTLPTTGKLKGWEFGNNVKMVCANVGTSITVNRKDQQNQNLEQYYAIQGNCPRCGFDLWKGDLILNDDAWMEEGLPRVACPTCSTTYNLRTGKYGSPLKRTGLQGFVSNLARQSSIAGSTNTNTATANAKAYKITIDNNTDKIYCLEL